LNFHKNVIFLKDFDLNRFVHFLLGFWCRFLSKRRGKAI
jgi:hypothetical protein